MLCKLCYWNILRITMSCIFSAVNKLYDGDGDDFPSKNEIPVDVKHAKKW